MSKEVLEIADGKVRVKEKKRSKYKNVPVRDPVDGYFHSKSEHDRWKELKLLQRAGKISDLRRQQPFPLIVSGRLICTYIADYVYKEEDFVNLSAIYDDHSGPWAGYVVEDRKGGKARTAAAQVFEIKRKLMKACYNIDIRITGKGT